MDSVILELFSVHIWQIHVGTLQREAYISKLNALWRSGILSMSCISRLLIGGMVMILCSLA